MAEPIKSTGYLFSSKADVIKKPDELLSIRDESARDILKEIGSISKEDYRYYERKKKYRFFE